MEKQILIADDGMILTDGSLYGKRISIGVDRDPSEFWQITQAEYDAIMEAEEEPATEEDYQSALSKFGVKL